VVEDKHYPRRIVPLWWSYRWRMWRLRLLTKSEPKPFEPGMDVWLLAMLPRIEQFLRRSRER
jgi:hypothetical protein